MPTTKPNEYHQVGLNEKIDLHIDLNQETGTLIHFFNPGCPCSRFNIKHYKSLPTNYGNGISFKAVIPEDADVSRAYDFIPDSIEVTRDIGNEIAKACGVYSAPQAVILNKDRQLFYRGNYNKARYCTNKQTNFAEQALQNLLEDNTLNNLSPYATLAYGCQFYK